MMMMIFCWCYGDDDEIVLLNVDDDENVLLNDDDDN